MNDEKLYRVNPRVVAHLDTATLGEVTTAIVLAWLKVNATVTGRPMGGMIVNGPFAGSPMVEVTHDKVHALLIPEALLNPVFEPSLYNEAGELRRFLIFCPDRYEAQGGVEDLLMSADTMAAAFQDCYAHAASGVSCRVEYQIVAYKTMKLVCQAEYDPEDQASSWKWSAS